MFLLRLLRYCTGFVRFRASGGFGERFLNLCKTYGIPLWDVQITDGALYASTTPQGYRQILPCAKKSGMRTKMCKKAGLPFLLFRLRRRSGLAVGAAILLCSLVFLSGRIWSIDVQGCRTVPEETVRMAAERAGLRIGVRKSVLQPSQTAIAAESELEAVSHLAVNVTGACAQIVVTEAPKAPAVEDASGTFHLVSSADAQLVVLEPYRGTVTARLYEPVLRGQLLISGINRNRDDSVSFVHAAGYAVGRTETTLTGRASANETNYALQKKKTVYRLFVLGLEIPLGKAPKQYDYAFDRRKTLLLGRREMPVGLLCTRYMTTEKSGRRPDADLLRLIAAERYLQQAKQFTGTRQRISETICAVGDKNEARMSGTLACYENIGVEKPFTVEETAEMPDN